MRLSASTAACVLATAVSAASTDRAECFETRSRDLARLASCGDWGSINYCLSQKSSPLADAVAANELASITAELESCFVNAGCTWDEAGVEAFWTLRRCEAAPAELRRRFVGLAAAPMTPVVARTPEMTAVADLVERQDATATTSNTSPSPCLTTSMVSTRSCPTQSTGSESGKTLSCFSTSVPTSVCAAGLICQTSTQGEISCMYKSDKLELSGIIVAVVMATAVTISIFSVCFFCCKERNTQKRLAKAAEAAEIAREAKNAAMVAAKHPEPSARIPSADQHAGQPLMPEGGQATGPNPFADTHPALR